MRRLSEAMPLHSIELSMAGIAITLRDLTAVQLRKSAIRTKDA